MVIVIRYRGSEACRDTCHYGIEFLNKNLERVVENSAQGGERVILYRMDYEHRTLAAVERYIHNSRKGDYDFYVFMSGKPSDLNEGPLMELKRSLDMAVGLKGKAGRAIGWKRGCPIIEKRSAGRGKSDENSYLRRKEYQKLQEMGFVDSIKKCINSILSPYKI